MKSNQQTNKVQGKNNKVQGKASQKKWSKFVEKERKKKEYQHTYLEVRFHNVASTKYYKI